MRASFFTAFVTAGLGAAAALAQPAPLGAASVPFSARNDGRERIACAATVAHWFSVDLGEAASGGAVDAALWSDPASGVVFILNESGDRMPVEALWCGLAGRSWATRSMVPLARRAGVAPDPIRIMCAPQGDRLVCR